MAGSRERHLAATQCEVRSRKASSASTSTATLVLLLWGAAAARRPALETLVAIVGVSERQRISDPELAGRLSYVGARSGCTATVRTSPDQRSRTDCLAMSSDLFCCSGWRVVRRVDLGSWVFRGRELGGDIVCSVVGGVEEERELWCDASRRTNGKRDTCCLRLAGSGAPPRRDAHEHDHGRPSAPPSCPLFSSVPPPPPGV